jgi:hypothetical protein
MQQDNPETDYEEHDTAGELCFRPKLPVHPPAAMNGQQRHHHRDKANDDAGKKD